MRQPTFYNLELAWSILSIYTSISVLPLPSFPFHPALLSLVLWIGYFFLLECKNKDLCTIHFAHIDSWTKNSLIWFQTSSPTPGSDFVPYAAWAEGEVSISADMLSGQFLTFFFTSWPLFPENILLGRSSLIKILFRHLILLRKFTT